MNIPKRIQLMRVKGWRIPGDTVICSRPSKWGNPFSVKRRGAEFEVFDRRTMTDEYPSEPLLVNSFKSECLAIGYAIFEHKKALCNGTLRAGQFKALITIADVTAELAGVKHLACWCRRTAQCHVDNYIAVLKGEI